MGLSDQHQRLHRQHHHNHQKQNDNGSDMKLEVRQDDAATLVSVVYVTAKPTFDGPIAGFTTIGAPQPDPSPSPDHNNDNPKPAPAVDSPTPDKAKPTPTPAAAAPSSDDADPSTTGPAPSKPTSHAQPTSDALSSKPGSPTADRASTATASATVGSGVVAAASASASADPSAASDGGMSGGAKAGVAIGVLLAVALIAAAAFAYYRHKKSRENHAIALDRESAEKDNPFHDGAAIPAAGAAGAVATAYGSRPATRDVEKAHAAHPANPFGHHAESAPPDSPNPFTNPLPANAAQAPGSSHGMRPNAGAGNSFAADAAAGAVAGAAAAGVAGAAAAKRSEPPKPLQTDRLPPPSMPAAAAEHAPLSPSPSQFSTTSMTSTVAAAAVAAGPSAATNVHRVQLDFKPSMEDELELTAGQLVRLLHEYDDGWALCIRLDRSQQGVVPRTCLSTRPVKPRNGPPPGFRPGAGSPKAAPRPQSPAQQALHMGPMDRAASPAPLAPRPASPAGPRPSTGPSPALAPRSKSPGPYGGRPTPPPVIDAGGRPRSNSAGDVSRARAAAPAKPSPMNPAAGKAASPPTKDAAPVARVVSGASSVQSGPVVRKPVPGQEQA